MQLPPIAYNRKPTMRAANLVAAIALFLSAAFSPAVAAKVSPEQPSVDFAEGTFRLPSSDWRILQPDIGRYAGVAVQAVRQVPGLDLLLNIQMKGPQTGSVDDVLATLVTANSEPAGPNWVVDFVTAGQRRIEGREYPSVTQRQHNDTTGETLDALVVWVVPPDFDARMRVIGVSLVDRHSTQVSAAIPGSARATCRTTTSRQPRSSPIS